MILKFNGQYLDFNADIDIEKKVKLFEEIDSADGDVSYEFQITLTSENLAILGPILPDSSDKVVYTQNDCEVLNDEGSLINRGSLRIERIISGTAYCSFLGGNSNWFALITGSMTDLRLGQFDKELNEANITASWNESEGLIFPVLDLGQVINRGYPSLTTEDFTGCFYLKTLFKEVFRQSGIKLTGDLLDDWLFNNAIVVCNTRSKNDINNNSFKVGNNSNNSVVDGDTITITFNQLTGNNFFVGSDITTDNQNFTVSAKMIADIKLKIKANATFPPFVSPVLTSSATIRFSSRTQVTTEYEYTLEYLNCELDAGDYIGMDIINLGPGDTVVTECSLELKPKYIYKSLGSTSVPLITKQEFVAQIMSLFCVIPSFDNVINELSIGFFDKVKEKEPIDISDFIEVSEIDYSEFISNYSMKNNFNYSESSEDDLLEYGVSNYIKYGAGVIEADNHYIEKSGTVVDSDITSPISYINSAFNASFEKITNIEFDESETQPITSVTDSSGIPLFNITDAADYFRQGDIVRIDTPEYSGDYIVAGITSTYIRVIGQKYLANSTGTATRLIPKFSTDDSFYLMVATGNENVSELSNIQSDWYLNQSVIISAKIAYFNLLAVGASIETKYKQSLSFGAVNNPLSFQKTLLDKYWKQFERILNDPVMLKVTGFLPLTVYNRLDFLHPVTIRTKESSNLYYVNRISGYKNSYTPCELELIKLP